MSDRAMNNVYGDVSRMLQNGGDSNQYQSASYEPSPYSQRKESPRNSELS